MVRCKINCGLGILAQQKSTQEELNNHINYIHYNPVKHGYTHTVKDWEYSSFHKFVKNNLYEENCGSLRDIENILDLEFE